MDAPSNPLTEDAVKSKLSAKGYSPEDINQYVNFIKQNPGALQKPETPQVIKGAPGAFVPTNPVGDFLKSVWNGAIPELAKGAVMIPKLLVNVAGGHNEGIDQTTKAITDAIDKYGTFDIPREYQQGIFANPRSFVNTVGQGTGMILSAIGLAELTGGAGDVAEGAALSGDAAEAAARAAQAKASLTGAAAFTTQMINPIWEKGKAAGLSDVNNARMTALLAPFVGIAGTYLPGATKNALTGIFGKEVTEATTAGLEEDLSALADKDASAETFKETAKRATERMNGNLKGILAKYGTGAAEGAGNMYFLDVMQNAGEQLYDNMFADKAATPGQGKFGTTTKELFSKHEFSQAMLGGFLGMGAVTLHGTPIHDQTLFGYLDNALRKGEGDKATDRLNKITDGLVQDQKLTPEQAAASKKRVEQINQTAKQFLDSKGMSADARYDAYNYQYNVKNHLLENVIKPHETAAAHIEEMKADPNSNPALIANEEKQVTDGLPLYESAKEQVAAVDNYLVELGKTGKIDPDFGKKLQEIVLKHNPAKQAADEAAAKQSEAGQADENKQWEDKLGADNKKHLDSLNHGELKETYTRLQESNFDGGEDNNLEYLRKLASEKNIDLPKTETDAKEVRSDTGPVHEAGVRKEAMPGHGGENIQQPEKTGAEAGGKKQQVTPNDIAKLPEEAKQPLRDKLKETVKEKDSYRDLLRKMRDSGAIEIKCKGGTTI